MRRGPRMEGPWGSGSRAGGETGPTSGGGQWP